MCVCVCVCAFVCVRQCACARDQVGVLSRAFAHISGHDLCIMFARSCISKYVRLPLCTYVFLDKSV